MSLPNWLAPLPDADGSRAIDAWAIDELRMSGLALMERAAQGLADVTQEVAPDGLIVVCCGSGNNGGDGYATARILRSAWREVRVLQVTDPDALAADALTQARQLPGDPAQPFSAAGLQGAAVVVDAMLEIGRAHV